MVCVDGHSSLLVTVAALMVGNLESVNNSVVTANDDQDDANLNRQSRSRRCP